MRTRRRGAFRKRRKIVVYKMRLKEWENFWGFFSVIGVRNAACRRLFEIGVDKPSSVI